MHLYTNGEMGAKELKFRKLFHLVIFESEVLKEGCSVGLDRVQAVVQHGNHLW